MVRHRLLSRFLAISVIVGIVLAPLSRPVMADMAPEPSMASMADDMSMSGAEDEMAGDMPCCPSKAPAPIDCDKCVLMAACVGQFFVGLPTTLFRPPFAVSGKIVPLQNDSWPDGLGHPPPEHPPRALV